jgi:hypothetical protein
MTQSWARLGIRKFSVDFWARCWRFYYGQSVFGVLQSPPLFNLTLGRKSQWLLNLLELLNMSL